MPARGSGPYQRQGRSVQALRRRYSVLKAVSAHRGESFNLSWSRYQQVSAGGSRSVARRNTSLGWTNNNVRPRGGA
jgi:hypothetical protein